MAKILLLADSAEAGRWAQRLREEGYEVELEGDARRLAAQVLDLPPDLLVIQRSVEPELIRDLVTALKENLNLSTLPVLLILARGEGYPSWEDLPVDDFFFEDAAPEEVVARVRLAFSRNLRIADNNPLTGLPGNTSILRAIQQKLDRGEEVAFCYADLDHFKPFNDIYGFSRGDEILRMVARLLTNSVAFHAGHRGFVGHIGGDDFVYIVPLEMAEEVAREIIHNFDQLLPHFLDEEDLRRGYFEATNRRGEKERFSFPAISIAIVPNYPGRFKHYGEVATVAAQVKKLAKKQQGSSYFVDRRQEAPS